MWFPATMYVCIYIFSCILLQVWTKLRYNTIPFVCRTIDLKLYMQRVLWTEFGGIWKGCNFFQTLYNGGIAAISLICLFKVLRDEGWSADHGEHRSHTASDIISTQIEPRGRPSWPCPGKSWGRNNLDQGLSYFLHWLSQYLWEPFCRQDKDTL